MHARIIHIWKTIIRQGILAVCFLSLHLHQHINSSCGRPSSLQNHKTSSCRQYALSLHDKTYCKPQVLPKNDSCVFFLVLGICHGTTSWNWGWSSSSGGFCLSSGDYNLLQPYGIRELCLMDNRLVNSFLSVIHQYCME